MLAPADALPSPRPRHSCDLRRHLAATGGVSDSHNYDCAVVTSMLNAMDTASVSVDVSVGDAEEGAISLSTVHLTGFPDGFTALPLSRLSGECPQPVAPALDSTWRVHFGGADTAEDSAFAHPRAYLPAGNHACLPSWPAELQCQLQPFDPLTADASLADALARVTKGVRRVPVVSADGKHIVNILSQSALLKVVLEMETPGVRSTTRAVCVQLAHPHARRPKPDWFSLHDPRPTMLCADCGDRACPRYCRLPLGASKRLASPTASPC